MRKFTTILFDYTKKRSLKERIVIRFLDSRIGRKIAGILFYNSPEFFVSKLRSASHKTFKDAEIDHKGSKNFEDLSWLFTFSPLNRGIVRLDFDEAAYLFKIARSCNNSKILEIGRFGGGSTLLLATAADNNSKVVSIDINPQNDGLLRDVLKKTGQLHKVELIVADANSIQAKNNEFNLIFIDGDHSYEAVLKDFEHWKGSLKPGCHLLFHDAGCGRRFASTNPGPARLVGEITENESLYWERQGDVGSLAHFIKTQEIH